MRALAWALTSAALVLTSAAALLANLWILILAVAVGWAAALIHFSLMLEGDDPL